MPGQTYELDKKVLIGIIAAIINVGIGIACIVFSARLVIYSSEDFKDKIIEDSYFLNE